MTTNVGATIYLNLPVADVAAARAFWTAVGGRISEPYSNDVALAVSLSDHVRIMLLQRDFFASFLAGRTIGDPRAATAAIVCLEAASAGDVDRFVDSAVAAGGEEILPADPNPSQEVVDAGLMYGRTFADLDGHVWEIMWMSDEMPEG